MDIIFMGTPEFASEHLKYLLQNKEELNLNFKMIFTNKDKQTGRGKKLAFSPVKQVALDNNLKLMQPESLKESSVIEEIKNINPDLIIVVAYGKILPKEILKIPKYGVINVHGSLLPNYRGAAPIQWAVLNGDTKSGISIIEVSGKLDAGDILKSEEIKIAYEDTTESLFAKMIEVGKKALKEVIIQIQNNTVTKTVQDEKKATYAKMLTKDMAKINWNLQVNEIYNLIRGMYGVYTARGRIGNNEYKIYKAKAISKELIIDDFLKNFFNSNNSGDFTIINNKLFVKAKNGLIEILELQAPNRKRLETSEFLRGVQDITKL